MPSEYVLKRPVMDINRIQKTAKKLIDESSEDRSLALDMMHYYRDMVEANPNDNTSKSLMVDCLKLAQSSKDKVIKIMDLLVKMEAATTKTKNTKTTGGDTASVFSALEELSNDW